MKRMYDMVATILLTITSSARAAPKSVTLEVPGMTCPTGPVTITKALMREQGVSSVVVRYEKKELVVSFDDTKITPIKLIQSTASVGFPSSFAK